MSLCDKTDEELRKMMSDAYTRGWRACLAEVIACVAHGLPIDNDFINEMEKKEDKDAETRKD